MPKFLYTARHTASGETRGGETLAKDEATLARELRKEGFLLTSVRAMDEERGEASGKFFDRFRSIPLKEKMVFTRNLAVMIGSGLTVSRAITNLAEQSGNKTFKKILLDVHQEIQAGRTLSAALAKYPSIFSELFVNMIYVGEVSGNLEKVLEILAVQLEKEHDLLSKVRGALMYPAVVLVAMVGIGILMLTYILPKITGVFQDMNVVLPPMTRFVIALSDFIRGHAIVSLGLVVGTVILLRLFSKTIMGQRVIGWLLLRMPAIGNIIIKVNCARFARIYSSLLRSGVSVIESLKIVEKTLGNIYYKDALREAQSEIQKGVELSKVILRHQHTFPILVPQMLQVGEETGKTEVVLEKLADFYEGEVDQITKNLSSIVEPILMLIIGGAVGFFAVAMLQPMYSVLENIK